LKIAVSSATPRGALAAGEQREPLDLLADGAHRDLDAGRQRVVRVGEGDAARSAREQDREHLAERGLRVFERGQEDRLHPLVEFADDRLEVAARLDEVGELLGEERGAARARRTPRARAG
jgi:hypothetical protein